MERQIKIVSTVGVILALVGSGLVFNFSFQDKDYAWAIPAAVYFVMTVVVSRDLLQMRGWGWKLAFLLALAALAFGVYVAYFRWMFWLFKTPTLWDRIKALFNLTVLLYIGCPALWIIYFTRPSVKSHFIR